MPVPVPVPVLRNLQASFQSEEGGLGALSWWAGGEEGEGEGEGEGDGEYQEGEGGEGEGEA